jgi:hypothetical protein
MHKGLAAAVMAAAFVLPAAGQQGLRDISGSVTDGHEPLRGAVVYCENESTQQVLTFLTDRSGAFRFHRLGGDTDYHVWAMYRGSESKKHFLSKFDAKKDKDLRLEVHLR